MLIKQLVGRSQGHVKVSVDLDRTLGLFLDHFHPGLNDMEIPQVFRGGGRRPRLNSVGAADTTVVQKNIPARTSTIKIDRFLSIFIFYPPLFLVFF